MRTLYIEEIEGNTNFQDVELLVFDDTDVRTYHNTDVFDEYWVPNKGSKSENVGSDFVHLVSTQTTTFLDTNTRFNYSIDIVRDFFVEILSNGQIKEVEYYTFYRKNNVVTKSVPLDYISLDGKDIPELFKSKVEAIAKYKKEYGESPRQTEAVQNKKNSQVYTVVITGLTMAGNFYLGKVPGGRMVVNTFGAGLTFVVQIHYPTDPKKVRVVSTYDDHKNYFD